MFRTSLKNKIYQYLQSQYPNWIHKGEIGRRAVNEWNFENENAGRRCRELENEGLIEARYTTNLYGVKCVEYRYIPPAPKTPQELKVESERLLMLSVQ